ncbi:THO complex subunit 7 homolog isoform X1 [Coccinella septempunctata]|uniref:THO complex subunit 7 homolog isoform X1 n=1 Tax=Coccinella septempunctata TaxID=41139 RepID=UPI001D0931F6|nr:THO complex subunit 7 homolog isoform X1 [Coccinella septempunctata]
MSDEEVIRRRLLIDGDGTGDDRRLNVILKNLTKWAHSTGTEPNDNQIVLDRTLWQLGLCEFSVKRSKILRKTSTKQLRKYSQIQEKLEMEITKTKDSIEESKNNLKQAKIWKQNHVMYDLLANTIVGHPARKETNKMLNNLQTELKNLKEQSKSLEMKLDLRKKQFHVLVTSANQLRAMLEEVENEDSNMNMSLIDITNSPEPEPMSE